MAIIVRPVLLILSLFAIFSGHWIIGSALLCYGFAKTLTYASKAFLLIIAFGMILTGHIFTFILFLILAAGIYIHFNGEIA